MKKDPLQDNLILFINNGSIFPRPALAEATEAEKARFYTFDAIEATCDD
jgi:hypothetical protein